MIKKSLLFFLLSLVVYLYTTFVLTILWNWFMTVAFHVQEISFWVMYGPVLIVGLFQNPTDRNFTDETRWKNALVMIHACVPEDRKEFVKEELEALKPHVWVDIAGDLLGRVGATTLILGVGFVIHILA